MGNVSLLKKCDEAVVHIILMYQQGYTCTGFLNNDNIWDTICGKANKVINIHKLLSHVAHVDTGRAVESPATMANWFTNDQSVQLGYIPKS